MSFSLPLGPARLARPGTVFRYTFEHFARGIYRKADGLPGLTQRSVVPIEAVKTGDRQVLAACEQGRAGTPVIDLDVLTEFPAVESVVVSTRLRASRQLPNIRELLFSSGTSFPDATTLRHFTGLEALYSTFGSDVKLDLDAIPASQMRKLAVNRWLTKSLAPLENMTGLAQFKAELFRDPLDHVARMIGLKYVSIIGPAKGWSKLRECTLLEEAHFINVQIANLRRWDTWKRLRSLTLSGRGVKSLAGLESIEQLKQLTLLNLHMRDLSPLRELSHLTDLTLRMPAKEVDVASVAALPQLRFLEVDDVANTDSENLHLPTVNPLAKASALEELALFCVVDDGDLTPLAELPKLRKLRLGPSIGADVEALRAARPDMQIDYTPPDPKWEKLKERVGAITIQRPGEGLEQWSIFESLAPGLRLATNYAAEGLIKKEVKKKIPELSKKLDWDTEAGAVAVYADSESDIRAVADIINDLLGLAAKREGG